MSQHTILIVEDEPSQRRTLTHMVADQLGYHVMIAEDGEEALSRIKEQNGRQPELVLLDLGLPEIDGMEVLKRVKPAQPDLPFIVLTGQEDLQTAVDAMKAGACDYLTKPAVKERLQVSIDNALRLNVLSGEVAKMQRSRNGRMSFTDLVGNSPKMSEAIALGERAADSDIPVLIEGESGVGKELFARAIHGCSSRAGKPFVAVNCGAIPETLAESTLFGHEKGAFTGAVAAAMGKFREADGGTLFLDEIGELKPDLQVKLLRALQEGEIEPVGGKKPQKVDVRIISATNRSLEEEVRRGAFREDLYYRLNVFPIHVPSLEERPEDIEPLVEHFMLRFAAMEGKRIRGCSAEAWKLLKSCRWPGNVRQLENVIFRAVVMAAGEELGATDFPALTGGAGAVPNGKTAENNTAGESPANGRYALSVTDDNGHIRPLNTLEAEVIRYALAYYQGHMSEVARRLGIGRSTLYRKLSEMELTNNKRATG